MNIIVRTKELNNCVNVLVMFNINVMYMKNYREVKWENLQGNENCDIRI